MNRINLVYLIKLIMNKSNIILNDPTIPFVPQQFLYLTEMKFLEIKIGIDGLERVTVRTQFEKNVNP